ncbi:protein NEDD1 [Phoenix dactylifera]|uniref:Protein NEDD1 n=1 Tax=Phoenix dactylifera TaxID=42345 RepID=A0A8B7BIL8_PHODC|nr:protein NEDD1 [Phoenix dactylifera]XP_008777715.1 protein NEDD1 [Phoenix dactylifera]XP_008777726.1 protein NEDD1 [Phoenix dactylifera]XP_017696201.1 protein NEDD1 [Phoenix dactylifera]XP_026657270.1 protein NEDD1 [Phoenix dactylifera]
MSFVDPSASLLATCGGDTVKIFDVTVDSGDPCVLSYTPSPGSQVNSLKWNHTNLVVASAGDDRKISLWHKNGQSMGVIPLSGGDLGDDIEEAIVSISFSNKGSRYLCSGGSGHIVRIWDLQRKRCIKWLSGHTDTITGVMYNCKDEHLASISVKGDLILHNLASGARAAELKDPNGQVLRVLDYSRLSRHILVTAGDDGSVHLWDTTGRSPKVSWLKQHSAPTTGVCFSPSSDKIIASVGLDKKLYTYDCGTRRSTSCTHYEAPFSSLAYHDDGNVLAAGTNNGRVVFYDVRGKPQPFTVLRAYNSSEAVTSLCWQRSKPVIVNENSCTAEVALLGGTSEDSVLMPDPLPSMAALSFPSATMPSFRSSLTASTNGSISATPAVEETPQRSRLWSSGSLPKLHAPRSSYNLKDDDMDVFSPLVDVQPITPSLGNWWDDRDEATKDNMPNDKKSAVFPSSLRRFPFTEGSTDSHPISDWRSNSTSKQDSSSVISSAATQVASSKGETSSFSSTPEAWGGNALLDKLTHRQPISLSRFVPSVSLATGPIFAGLQDSSSSSSHSKNSATISSTSFTNMQNKLALNHANSSVIMESSSAYHLSSVSTSLGTKMMPSSSSSNLELPGTSLSTFPRRYSTYAERISTTSSFSEGIASAVGSPKSKKTGAETREELLNSLLSGQEASNASGTGSLPAINGVSSQSMRALGQPTDQQGTSSFSLQLVQHTLEETLGSLQKSIHEDVRNLHIELLRQFHMQETAMVGLLTSILEKQDELMKEVQSLRRENQQLRQLL